VLAYSGSFWTGALSVQLSIRPISQIFSRLSQRWSGILAAKHHYAI